MILSNLEIQKALKQKRLVIDPLPQPERPGPGVSCPYDTHTVDLHLGNEVSVPTGGPFEVDFSQPGKIADFINQHSERHEISAVRPYTLEPKTFVLARTLETVSLPLPKNGKTCLAARIEGKSSRARFGLLIHFTAPTIHPGFRGTITLEMINLGPAKIALRPGIAIAQLIVEEVKGLPFENRSQFYGQTTPEGRAKR